jgi:hypothetical protein
MAQAPLRIIRFWTAYTQRDGANIARDMVEYCAPGMAQRATTVAVVDQLSRIRTDVDPDNPAYRLARERWGAIEPAYAAWKKGHEITVDGTPLAAWPGVTPEQAEVLRTFGLRTVEEVANATDSVIARVQLPGVRDLQANARAFLEAADRGKVAAELARKDDEIAALKADMEELKAMLVESMQANEPDLEPDGSEAPRRRGRPPKARDEVAA